MLGTWVRVGRIAAFVAAASWLLSGLVYFALVYQTFGPGEPGSTSVVLIYTFHALAEVAMLFAFVGVRDLDRSKLGPLAAFAFPVAYFGLAALALITAAVLIALESVGETIVSAVFGVGLIATFLGMILVAASVWRARVLPRWGAILLGLQPVFIFIVLLMSSYGFGALAIALAWVLVGFAFGARKSAPAPSPATTL